MCRCFLQYLTLESSFEGKDYVCDRLLQFLLTEASSGVSDKLSFQLMEALLHRIHLNLFTGRMESALAILQVRQQRSDVPVNVLSAIREQQQLTEPEPNVCLLDSCRMP